MYRLLLEAVFRGMGKRAYTRGIGSELEITTEELVFVNLQGLMLVY